MTVYRQGQRIDAQAARHLILQYYVDVVSVDGSIFEPREAEELAEEIDETDWFSIQFQGTLVQLALHNELNKPLDEQSRRAIISLKYLRAVAVLNEWIAHDYLPLKN